MSLENFIKDFKDKKVLVFGLGILGGGEGVVQSLIQAGAHIRITDLKTEAELSSVLQKVDLTKIDALTLEKHSHEDIDWADIIIKNPAVPSDNEYILYSNKQGKQVTTEAALFLKYTDTITIGITGTRGKTTTTSMIHHVIKNTIDPDALIGGNIQEIGTLPLLFQEKPNQYCVLELSSFALEGCHLEKVSPHIAVITNLYPDHMNRYHQDMTRYAYDKKAICEYQTTADHVFLNPEGEWSTYFAQNIESQVQYVDYTSVQHLALSVPGKHNLMNAAFALATTQLLGIEKAKAEQLLSEFKGVRYRLETVGTNDEHTFINDSTSTTPEALIAALQTFPTATFIIGGTTKQLELTHLASVIETFQGKIIYLEGSGSQELAKKLTKPPAQLHSNLESAFQEAISQTAEGQIVFSPGFTSFEMFKNEFDRAQSFDRLVKAFCNPG